jgi:membrane-bound lytic murein transglycosylase D
VRQQEQWYATRPDYIQRMTDRSRKYLFHIVEELERRNMPTELALLPFIESAFNPQAVSSARAAGMWQFMPATGRDYDLKQNIFRDDRRDVLASTRAALDYLQRLYGMFGDWHLALAAYNWGEGNVGRAIARNQRAGLGTGYTDLNMPNETRNYVPKLQAVKNIVASPAFRADLPLIENHPYFQSVTLGARHRRRAGRALADVELDDFKALNPQPINRPVILAAGTPQILLPWDNATVFKRNFDAYTRASTPAGPPGPCPAP